MPPVIALPSVQSLLVSATLGESELGQGTAFMVREGGVDWLVTNWHVAAGRNRETGQPMHRSGATPDTLKVWHNATQQGERHTWRLVEYELFDDNGEPKWFEHPVHGRRVDVVALGVAGHPELTFYPHSLDQGENALATGVAEDVSIIGFPFGIRAAGAIAVWSRGSIASEPDVDFDGLPCFLIDSRTRTGQSGSPVIKYSSGAGGHRLAGGGLSIGLGPIAQLLGVYSGRINPESDLGTVWKVSALRDIIYGRERGNADLVDPKTR